MSFPLCLSIAFTYLKVNLGLITQKIVGMEENQAMMSRAELHSMITQLEEAEVRAANKPAAELSGIRTNPSDMSGRKRSPVSQEDKQLSWR